MERKTYYCDEIPAVFLDFFKLSITARVSQVVFLDIIKLAVTVLRGLSTCSRVVSQYLMVLHSGGRFDCDSF